MDEELIRVVVLGSAASLPSKKHVPSCIAVKYGGVYLFDACEGVQRQMMTCGVSFAKLRAVFLSHLHADHYLGLFGLVQTLNLIGRKEPLLVFGPKGTAHFLKTVFGTRQLAPRFDMVLKDVERGTVLKEKLFDVKAFPVKHGCRAIGYALQEKDKTKFNEEKARAKGIKGRLFTEIAEKGFVKVKGKEVKLGDVTFKEPGRKIVYSGDTTPCPVLTRACKDASLAVLDACFSDKDKELAKEKLHSTALQAAETAKKAGAKKLVLTHLSHRYDDRSVLLEEAKAVFPESVLAKEGLELMV